MRLNIGSSDRLVAGFTAVDIRRGVARGVKAGQAADLRFAPDSSVEVLFCNAVFEHIFLAHHLRVLREWKRVLKPGGAIVILAVPDFETIARLYLEGAPGIDNPRFDLFQVYRYTHGDPESRSVPLWQRWNPAKRPNSAPAGYVPQLHKALFDADYLSLLFAAVGVPARVFRYVYPGEVPAIQLGVVAGGVSVDGGLALIPNIDVYVDLLSVTEVQPVSSTESQMAKALLLHEGSDSPRWRTPARWVRRKVRIV